VRTSESTFSGSAYCPDAFRECTRSPSTTTSNTPPRDGMISSSDIWNSNSSRRRSARPTALSAYPH
jgi:hypothetical protein